jgi:U3 small nucleolar RNA-associated protein 20
MLTLLDYLLNAFQDLEGTHYEATPFTLLNRLVSATVMLPKIYDLMSLVSKSILVTHSDAVRNKSRKIFLRFILNYPLGKPNSNTLSDNCRSKTAPITP